MKKRVQAWIMALIMLFTTVALPLLDAESVQAAEDGLTMQIHYLREDGNYADWDIWAWGEGAGSATTSDANAFIEEDENGAAVAEIGIVEGSKKVGFLVRKTDWSAKDWDSDRFVDVEGYIAGTVHVYVTSGQEEIEVDYSKAIKESLTIQFHYLREDGNYDGWDIWAWGSKEGSATTSDANAFIGEDENGAAVAEVEVVKGSTEIGYLVRRTDWSEKDPGDDRFVDVAEYGHGTIHVYLTSGTAEVETDYSGAIAPIVKEEEEEEKGLTIQLHYLREDKNYDNWDVWAWGSKEGSATTSDANAFIATDDEGAAVAEIGVVEGSSEVGFLVRKTDWSAKDWDQDRFIDVEGYVSGVIHVYVTSGQEAIKVNYDEAEREPIKIHFFLDKKKTDADWGLWLWDDIGTPAIYPLFVENEDGRLQITYEVAAGATWVGFIVRDNDWQKDPDGDRQVDVSQYVGGEITVELTSGSADFEPDYSKAVTGVKLKTAIYENNTIVVTTSSALEELEDAFKVLCGEEEVAIKSIVAGEKENTYVLSFDEKLDLTKAYSVVFGGNAYKVNMPSLYKDTEWVAENTYTGKDLGATWTKDKTVFKVWAPLASEVTVNLYEEGEGGEKIDAFPMEKTEKGVWAAAVQGDLNGVYYTYTVNNAGDIKEACDPYAKTTGINGNRAMVIDMASTNPEGWEEDENPNADLEFTDIVLYELHVRDASIDESSGVSEENKGNFLGLTEHGDNTILDHMVDLGITHVHLLPVYDINSVDEKTDGFNWGYDPKNYNVPEGSYSSDPYNGDVRVKEMKEMVQTLHENGISVVMDVVYNHVADAGNFCFNQIVPNYFSRMNENGGYSNDSGCGNDTASEHVMVRKYIVESVKYWADEYHIDGFRFDLVGLIDTITINEIMKEVWSDHPDVIFYGEGWSMNSYDTGVSMTVQSNADEVPGFAFFNDTFRDAVKGSVFENTAPGWATGATGLEEKIEQSFLGASIWGSESTVCPSPLQTINYTSCHDNNTLYDRLKLTLPEASEEVIAKINNLIAAYTFTAQGVPFMHAAEEFLRSKPLPDGGYDHNSYSSGDAINSIKWDTLDDNIDTYNYYKGLIEFRKAHAALRMTDAATVAENIKVIDGLDDNVVAFEISRANGEKSDRLFIIFNPNQAATTVALPDGEWNIYVNAEDAGTDVLGTAKASVKVDAISAMVLVDEAEVVPEKGEEITAEDIEIAEDYKESTVVVEDDVEYVVLENAAMEDLSIKGEKDVIAEDAFFVRKYLEAGKKFEAAKNAVEAKLKNVFEYKALEIDLYAGDGTQITELDGYVFVTIPKPADIKVAEGNTLVVYRVEDGNLVNCGAKVEGDYLTFKTNHFSTFVIAEQEITADVPNTGDNSQTGLYFFILLAGVAVTMAGVANSKKRCR